MYSELSQIFYPYNKFDSKEKLNELHSYIYRGLPLPIMDQSPPNVLTTKKEEPIFYPKKQNSLFWCIYIFIHGYDEYQMIHNSRHSTVELSENQKIIDFLRSNPKIIKSTNHKTTNIKSQELLSDLMIGKKTNISLLIPYAIFYKTSIVVSFCNKNVVLEVIPEISEKQLIIYYDKNKNYGIDLSTTDCGKIINHLRDKNIFIENYDKALKSISHYKTEDLREMAKKLGIEMPLKIKKNEMYSALENYFMVLLEDWQKN
jgi:hypothetical protein